MSKTTLLSGMITEAQTKKISELVSMPEFQLPVAGFLKNVTDNKVSSIDELTSAQANDVIAVASKLIKVKK